MLEKIIFSLRSPVAGNHPCPDGDVMSTGAPSFTAPPNP